MILNFEFWCFFVIQKFDFYFFFFFFAFRILYFCGYIQPVSLSFIYILIFVFLWLYSKFWFLFMFLCNSKFWFRFLSFAFCISMGIWRNKFWVESKSIKTLLLASWTNRCLGCVQGKGAAVVWFRCGWRMLICVSSLCVDCFNVCSLSASFLLWSVGLLLWSVQGWGLICWLICVVLVCSCCWLGFLLCSCFFYCSCVLVVQFGCVAVGLVVSGAVWCSLGVVLLSFPGVVWVCSCSAPDCLLFHSL